MFRRLRADIEAAKRNDPAARNKFEIWLTYSGVHALSWHRFANRLYKMHLKLLARMVSQWAKFLTGIEIHPAAKIEGGVFIDHGAGAVVLKEVPPHATVVGVPGRIVRIRGEKPDLSQEKVDPNAEEIRALKCRVHKLEAALEKLTGERYECTKEEENLFPVADGRGEKDEKNPQTAEEYEK